MATVLTEVDDFTASITAPDGGDARSDAAEVVTAIAQKLANRTKNLNLHKAGLSDLNVFTVDQEIDADLHVTGAINADDDVHSDFDLNAGRDLNSVRDAIVGRNVLVFGEVLYQAASIATFKSRTTIISLNDGIVLGVSPALALVRDAFTAATCASWTGAQYVAWKIRLPTGAKLQHVDVIHNTSTSAPNRFNILRRSGAVYDIVGAGTTIPSVTSLCTAPADGPSSAVLATTAVLPTAAVTIDNSVNEYWFTWISTGAHAADAIAEIHVVWDDYGYRND